MNQIASTRRLPRLLAAVTALACVWLTLSPAASAEGLPSLRGSDSALLTQTSGALAPGLDLTSFRRIQPGGWVTGHVMTANLAEPTLSMDVVDADAELVRVSGTDGCSDLACRVGTYGCSDIAVRPRCFHVTVRDPHARNLAGARRTGLGRGDPGGIVRCAPRPGVPGGAG